MVPLTPTLGADVYGIDLSQPLDKQTAETVETLLLKYKCIFFRKQTLDNFTQVRCVRQLSEHMGIRPHSEQQQLSSKDVAYPTIFGPWRPALVLPR